LFGKISQSRANSVVLPLRLASPSYPSKKSAKKNLVFKVQVSNAIFFKRRDEKNRLLKVFLFESEEIHVFCCLKHYLQ